MKKIRVECFGESLWDIVSTHNLRTLKGYKLTFTNLNKKEKGFIIRLQENSRDLRPGTAICS